MKDTKDDLLNIIKKSRNKSSLVVEGASKIGEYGQYVSDLADASENAISCISSTSIDWQPQIRSWRYLDEKLDGISRDMGQINIDVASSSASTATSCMLNFVNPDYLVPLASPDRGAEARTAATNLGQVIDRLAEKSKALALLHEFGLSEAAPNKKSPTELLEAACAAFEKPVTQETPASTSLIPMRECINSTFATLLQRRPKQEPAGSHSRKVLSIGKQVARVGVEEWVIESMADRWEKLSGELSDSKQKNISRMEWRTTLRKAMVLLIEFLQSLDQTKMK